MTPPDSDEREVLTTGQRAEVSIAVHRQRLRVMFEENEARPLPDTSLRSVLLDADRFADEYAAAPHFVGIVVEPYLAQRILAALEEESKRHDDDFGRGIEEAAKLADGFGTFGRGLVKAIRALAREPQTKPTVAELEAILAQPDGTYETYSLPNGEVRSRVNLNPLAAELRAVIGK